MKAILTLTLLIFAFTLSAQTWTTFTNHKDVQDIVKDGNTLWVGTTGGLLKWNLENETHEKFTTSDGLISNEIRQLAIDEEGNIWIATSRGISLLNTEGQFSNYTTADGLLYNDISSVVIDSGGNKWFGTQFPYETNGLMKLDTEGEWTIYNPEEFLYNTRLRYLAIDENDNIWIATHAGVLRFNNDETWTVIATHSQTEPSIYTEIALDSNGDFWGVNNYGGVTHYDFEGNHTFFDESDGVPHYTLSIFIDEDDVKWFSSTAGLSKMEANNIVTTYPHDTEIHTLFVEEDKIISGTEDDIDIFEDEEWTTLVSQEGFLSNDVRDVEIANEGSIFFATQKGIEKYSTDNEWSNFSSDNGIQCDNTWTLLATEDDRLLISHLYNCVGFIGLSEIDLQTNEGSFMENDSFGLFISMHEDMSGNIWIGYFSQPGFGANALKILADGTIVPIDFSETLFNDQPSNKTLDIDERPDGTLYFSTRGGGLTIDPSGEQELFWNSACTTSLFDSQGNIWIGEGDYWSPGHKLYKQDGIGEITEYDIPGLSTAFKYEIVEDVDGNIWFATDNGLYKRSLDDTFTHYTTADGLADDDVTDIEIDLNGRIWLSTKNGVSSSADFPSALINKPVNIGNLLIYPNPSEGVFNIDLAELNGVKGDITVFNSLGQKIYQSTLSNSQGSFTLDLNGQASGIYFIQVETGENTLLAKVSKL